MGDLRDWLRGHGLEQYADAFEANDIDLDILPDLNEGDLEQLGLSLGNRRRLLKAIAGLGTAAAPSQSSSQQKLLGDEKPAAAEAAGSGDAERRQVTVMFADMVGSTALSAKVDPELLGGLIRRYQDAVAGAIGRYGGFVAKFMGDGVLAYFGFPCAFEDAAERAVRAAIGILSEVGDIELPDNTRVQARIGIATGLVVVGEIIGTGTAQERTIVGETPNLAARLQALAGPDRILVSESTQKLLGGLFELTHIGEHDLKGFARPVPAWQVCGEASVESRFAAIRIGGSLPLIGRAHEMGLMCPALATGAAGRGPDRDGDRRSRHREIARDRGAAGGARHRAACARQSAMLALSQRQRALSGDPVSQSRRRLHARRYAGGADRKTPRLAREARHRG